DFVGEARAPELSWVLADLVLRKERPVFLPGGTAEFRRRVLEAASRSLADDPALGYAARHEHARLVLEAGDRRQARKLFLELHEKSLQDGAVPVLSEGFRKALEGDSPQWSELMRKTADRLLGEQRPLAVVALAWQCFLLDDEPLADELL